MKKRLRTLVSQPLRDYAPPVPFLPASRTRRLKVVAVSSISGSSD